MLKPPKDGNEYTLKAQGPVVELSDDLGTKPLFTLDDPIPIKEGDIIALTVPTWVPNFAVDLSDKNVWRASRDKGACEDSNDIKKGQPHQKVGSERAYGCTYRQARILYTANYVPPSRDRHSQISGFSSHSCSNCSAGLPAGGGMSFSSLSSGGGAVSPPADGVV